MARDLEEGTVYFSQGGTMPLKWTAPEVILSHSIFPFQVDLRANKH